MNKQKTKERKMRKTRSQKGITLIALIITIVILLILAVVAIQAVTGDGIIFHAENATTEYGIASEKESIQLAVMSAKKYIPNVSIDTAELENQLGKIDGITIAKGTEKWTVTSEKTGLVYEINISTGDTLSEEATAIVADTAPGTLETVATNTYEINSIEDLVALAYNVNSGTNTYSGATVTLGRNLYFDGSFNSYANPDAIYELDGNLGYKTSTTATTTIKSLLTSTDGIGFVPINGFQGTFDGNGNFLDGMYINANAFGGLFGNITSEITISNLGITNGNIKGNAPTGGFVGNTNSSLTITDCYYTGYLTSNSVPSGGIVGNAAGTLTTISNSHNSAIIECTGGPVGGICGMTNTLSIDNCSNIGNISCSNQSIPVGGIIGVSSSATMIDCYNSGVITSVNIAGGMLGQGGGTIINCFNTGNVTSATNIAGGIIATVGGTEMTIKNCYNSGNITTLASTTDNGLDCPVGGIVGKHNVINCALRLYNCYNTGDISSTSTMAGGIGGYLLGTITNCYNTGIVSSTSSRSSGICAGSDDATITTCYSTGTLYGTTTGTIDANGTATVSDCSERTINDFLTIFNNYVTTNNSNSANTQLRQWQLAGGKLMFSL